MASTPCDICRDPTGFFLRHQIGSRSAARSLVPGAGEPMRLHRSMQRLPFVGAAALLPTLPVRIPHALGKQAIDVGQGAVAAYKEAEAFAVCLARPFPRPRLAARIVWIEAVVT